MKEKKLEELRPQLTLDIYGNTDSYQTNDGNSKTEYANHRRTK